MSSVYSVNFDSRISPSVHTNICGEKVHVVRDPPKCMGTLMTWAHGGQAAWHSLQTSVYWVPFQTLPGWPHTPSLPKLDIFSTPRLSLSKPPQSQANTSQPCPGLPKPAQAYPNLPEHAQACPLACPCHALHASTLGRVPFFHKVQADCALAKFNPLIPKLILFGGSVWWL